MMDASPYLSRPARTLREACHETGRDAAGGSCLDCPLADLCEKNAAGWRTDGDARARVSNDGTMSGAMHWGMGLVGTLVVVVLMLSAVALAKYIFTR